MAASWVQVNKAGQTDRFALSNADLIVNFTLIICADEMPVGRKGGCNTAISITL
jgi:hypothetical protein